MGRLITFVLVMALCASGVMAAGVLQLKAADTFIATHQVPDSAGTAYTPADSVQVTVTYQDGTESLAAVWYNNADAQAALVNTNLYFFDAWDDMNGSDGVGTYTVLLRWYDGSSAALDLQETYLVQQTTMGLEDISDTVQGIIDTLQTYDGVMALAATQTLIIDTVNGIMDTVQTYDGVIALAANQTLIIDTVNGIMDTLQLQDGWVATEATAAKALDSLADVLDTLESYDDWVATDANQTLIIDTVNGIIDTVQTYDGVLALAATQTLIVDTVNGMMDTLQNYPARVDLVWDEVLSGHTDAGSAGDIIVDSLDALVSSGSAADLTDVTDSINAILDTLQTYDGVMALAATQTLIVDTVNGMMDSLQLQDGWVATSANQTLIIDTIQGIIDTVQTYDGVIALAATQTLIVDTVNGLIDSLNNFPARVDLIWDEILATHTVNGSVGEVLLDSIDAAITNAGSGSGLDTLSTVFSDRLMSRVIDSVWHANFEAHDGTAGSFGDSAQGWGATGASQDVIDTVNAILDTLQLHDGWVAHQTTVDSNLDSVFAGTVSADVVEISGDATAADNVEDAFDESGTSAVRLELEQIAVITSVDDSNAVVFQAGGAGSGLLTKSDSSGCGLWAIGGPSVGAGDVANFGSGIRAEAAAGIGSMNKGYTDGSYHWGTAAGADGLATYGGAFSGHASGFGTAFRAGPGGGAFLIDGAGTGDIAWMIQGIAPESLIVLDTTGSAAEIDFFLHQWGIDTASVPALGSATMAGIAKDTAAYQGAAAGVTDESVADAVMDSMRVEGIDGDVADTVNAILDTLQTYDGVLALAATQTLIIDTVNAALDTLQLWDTRVDSIEAALADANLLVKVFDTDIDATLKSLVISNSGGDAVQFTSTGNNGYGFRTTGNGTAAGYYTQGGATGAGILSQGGATSGNGAIFRAHADGSGSGINAQGYGALHGIYAVGGPTGQGLYVKGGTTDGTYGLYVTSGATNGGGASFVKTGTGVEITAALVDTINAILDTIQTYDGVMALASNQTLIIDTVNAMIDTLQNIDGDGQYKDTIFVVDTSGTDVAVSGVKVEVRASNNVVQGGPQWTDATGKTVWSLDAATYNVYSSKTGFLIPDGSVTVADNASDTVTGYDRSATSPSAASLCTVRGYLKSHSDKAYYGAIVTAVRVGVAVDTTGTTVIVGNTPSSAEVDTTGLFELELVKTGEFSDTTKGFYDIRAVWNMKEIFSIKALYIPDAATLELGDSLAVR